MATAHFIQAGGVAGMVGGAVWTAALLRHAAKPVGCVAEACADRAMRESTGLDAVLMLAAITGFTLAGLAVVVLAKRSGRFGRAGGVGIPLVIAGGAVVLLASVVQAAFFDNDFRYMPWFVIPGGMVLLAGLALVGVGVLRAHLLPTPVVASFLLAVLVMPFFNEQTHAVLLGLPLGLAWFAVGWAVRRAARAEASGPQTSAMANTSGSA